MRVKLEDLPLKARQQAQAQLDAQRKSVPRETGNQKPAKFGNELTEVNGITFDSKWEAQRYGELLLMEREGIITGLEVHVSFSLDVMTKLGEWVRIGAIEVDFRYWRGDAAVIEDTKSVITRRHPLYLWKKNHFEVQYGMKIREMERNKPRSGVTT